MSTVGEKVYYGVIEEVINGVRDLFLDEGVDEQVLQELKLTWEKKLHETKVLDYGGLHKDSGGGTANASSSSNSRSNSNQANNSTSRTTNSSRATNIIRDSNQNQATTSVTVIQSPSTTLSSSQAHVNLHQSQQHASIPPTNSSTQQQQQSKPSNPPHLIASTGATSSRSLNYNPGNIIPQTLIQYTAGQNSDGSKSVTIVPKNVALAYNPQTSGLTTVMGSSGAASLALSPELAASILQQASFNSGTNVINVTHNHQPQDIRFGGSSNNQSSALNNGPTLQIQATTSNSMDQRTVLANSRDSRPSTGCTNIVQLDGPNDSSEEEEEDEDDFRENDDDNDDDQNDDEHDYTGEEEEPLNSEDDVSDEDPHELFDTDNVVVCQYDKITRSRNKWKFHLKDGIMNLQGKDYVFQKAIGDAEW